MPGTDDSLNAVFESQNALKTKYANFNTAYGKYLTCMDVNNNADMCLSGGIVNNVDYSPSLQTETDALYNQLGGSASAKTELEQIIALNRALGTVGTPANFDASYNSIKLKRAQLDQKLQEL